MKCKSCNGDDDVTCKECYRELKAKLAFLTTSQPASFSDVLLFASDDGSKSVPAHKAVLLPVVICRWRNDSFQVSRSPVLRAMLENEMEESLSSTISIGDVSYDALHAFVSYLYTTEVSLDQQLACDLLILAEKYQVQHLKDYCQKFLVSNLNWGNSFLTYTFAHRHNAKRVIDAALALLITGNMDKITAQEEYAELKKNDPGLVFEIYEAYLSKQLVDTAAAAHKDSSVAVSVWSPRHPTKVFRR